MSYFNQIIRRTKPATRCQCAVIAVLSDSWSEVDEIWKRRPVYCENKYGRIRRVGYGTIHTILRSLVQQGYARSKPHGPKKKLYRSAR